MILYFLFPGPDSFIALIVLLIAAMILWKLNRQCRSNCFQGYNLTFSSSINFQESYL